MYKLNTFVMVLTAALLTGCGGATDINHTNHSNAANTNAAPAGPVNLTSVDTPQRIKDMVAGRGDQDAAEPDLEITVPEDGSTVETSTVRVALTLGGALKGYIPGMNPETKMGNHIHVILDNQPYEAYYNIEEMFELRNVPDGEHTLRVFASRPWHESYKNELAFDVVKFTVKNGGADLDIPASTNNGQQMANTNSNTASKPTPEGKDMPASKGGSIDVTKPLLTYSRPKGEYKGADADPIMIDFWLANAKLVGDGGEYRVRYSVNGGEPKFIEKWAPLWLTGWTAGKHTIKLELVDKDGNVVDNGGYNSTTREFTVVK